jgi:hypothetical protein
MAVPPPSVSAHPALTGAGAGGSASPHGAGSAAQVTGLSGRPAPTPATPTHGASTQYVQNAASKGLFGGVNMLGLAGMFLLGGLLGMAFAMRPVTRGRHLAPSPI